jgi:hypothetical protein
LVLLRCLTDHIRDKKVVSVFGVFVRRFTVVLLRTLFLSCARLLGKAPVYTT